MEAMGPSKVSTGPVSPYSSSGVSHSPMSSSAPSPSGSGAHNGGISSPAHHPSQQNLSTPPPAHIGSYTNLSKYIAILRSFEPNLGSLETLLQIC